MSACMSNGVFIIYFLVNFGYLLHFRHHLANLQSIVFPWRPWNTCILVNRQFSWPVLIGIQPKSRATSFTVYSRFTRRSWFGWRVSSKTYSGQWCRSVYDIVASNPLPSLFSHHVGPTQANFRGGPDPRTPMGSAPLIAARCTCRFNEFHSSFSIPHDSTDECICYRLVFSYMRLPLALRWISIA